MNEFIEFSDDNDLINADIEINKDNRRNIIREKANASNRVSSYEDELDEDYADLDMDMNEINIKIMKMRNMIEETSMVIVISF